MKKATIKIEVFGSVGNIVHVTEFDGETFLIMKGLTNAIKELESQFPEEHRAEFRTRILKMLNDRD